MEAQRPKEKEAPPPARIGDFPILKRIGKGGMGEVFLAKDPSCDRLVAIKRVRPDLNCHEIIRSRLLKEAKVTATLCHPSIMPVYSIHNTDDELYYVMPYVDGDTLKTILRDTIQREKNGDAPHPIGYSINSLLHIFINVCQAVSYCHSQGILHRDLKPENILIANFGQVLIFDWGLAGHIGTNEASLPDVEDSTTDLTRPGKVLGTLSYMPPERVDGTPADESTDLYSLGVILYQLLTLRMPFHRKSIKSYRKFRKHEELIDALEAAPYRDIPPKLAKIAKRCLAAKRGQRYHSVKELLWDLDRYKAGLADWVFSKSLSVDERDDWELQENILISKLVEITRSTDLMNWYMLMISKQSFSGNKKLEIRVTLKKGSDGIGFLLNIPEPKDREGLEDGYLLWIGSKSNPGVTLYRSDVNVLDISDFILEEGKEYRVEIEKIDQHVRCHIDSNLVLNFQDTLPIVGTHVGLLCSDMEFDLAQFDVLIGSQNALVGCLSIPDAFLASKNFEKAIAEYERISESFAGRSEGKEAIFRKGVALIELAKHTSELQERESLLNEANTTFERLHHTSYEAMEYLGKSLVYQKSSDLDEETKCLELGMRKLQKSPLFHLLEERIVFRLHESAKNDRKGVYNFAFLCLRYLSRRLSNRETHSLVHGLTSFCEYPSFLVQPSSVTSLEEKYRFLTIALAFWMNRPIVLDELMEDEPLPILKEVCKMALMFLGHNKSTIDTPKSLRHFLFNWERRLYFAQDTSILEEMKAFDRQQLSSKQKVHFDQLRCWASLLKGDLDGAKKILILHTHASEEKTTSPFFMLNGCFLARSEGFDRAMEHFRKTPDYVYPPLYSLLAHYLKGGIGSKGDRWSSRSFGWEQIALNSQLSLFYSSLGEVKRAQYYERKLKELD